MKIMPKTIKEAREIVYNILNQGDSRYNDPERELILSEFIVNKAISLEEKEILNIKEPTERELESKFEVQIYPKYVAKSILKQEGFEDSEIIFERSFFGLRPDVFAKNNNKLIVVECYSCKISKIIHFLPEVDEVWVITRGDFPWEKVPFLGEKAQLFVFKKGINWKTEYEALKKQEYEQIKKVKNPLDKI